MEQQFFDMTWEQRTVCCMKFSQMALGRSSSSPNDQLRELNLNLARCWQSLARQFDTIGSLRSSASK
jgi:hypothetical protein